MSLARKGHRFSPQPPAATKHFLSGLYNAGKDMVVGAYDMMVTANNAYEAAKMEVYSAIRAGSLDQIREKAGVIAAKGERALSELQQCYESIELIMGDAQCRQILCDFPERYFDILHITDKAQVLGSLSLDIVLALFTGGAAAAASGLSKSRYFARAAALVKRITRLLKRSKQAKRITGRTNTQVSAQIEKWTHKQIKKHDHAPSGNAAAEKSKQLNAKNTGKNLADTGKGEPVNCVTGEVLIEQNDFTLPGRLPLSWDRRYGSQDTCQGLCGHGWQTPADARIEEDDNGRVTFLDGLGNASVFDRLPPATFDPDESDPNTSDSDTVMAVADGAVLSLDETHFKVRLKSGLTYHFANSLPLLQRRATRISTPDGHWIGFGRDITGLSRIDFDDGRSLDVISANGRIEQIELDSRILIAYQYNDQGDLTAAVDTMGSAHRYEYHDRQVTRHTDRVGLSFYYTYDDQGRCTHTHGDNGLYDYRFTYNDLQTVVTNSLGGIQIYAYDDCRLPVRVTDTQGNQICYD